MEQTLVLIKPDAVQRGLVGKIISRFEEKGLKITALKMEQISRKPRPIIGSTGVKPLSRFNEFITSAPWWP